jgi:competence protein ComEC
MGDAEAPVENDLIHGLTFSADIIKIGHHGSDTSSTKAFLTVIDVQCAVISVGSDNSFGHPDESVISRLIAFNITTYRTDQCGTITFTYLPFFDRAIVTKDNRDNLFNNELSRFVGFF